MALLPTALLLGLLCASEAAKTDGSKNLRGDHDLQRALTGTITAPIDLTEMAEFAIALTPLLERTLQESLSQYDPYPIGETVSLDFPNIDVSSACPGGKLDANAEVTIVEVTGMSSLQVGSMTVSNPEVRSALPQLHWRGDFAFSGTFADDLVATVDVRLTGSACFGFVNVDETIHGVLVTLEDPTVDINMFLRGHLDTMTKLVSLEEAEVTGFDLAVSGVTTSGFGNIIDQYVPTLGDSLESSVTSSIDTYIEPRAQEAINAMLATNLPVALSV